MTLAEQVMDQLGMRDFRESKSPKPPKMRSGVSFKMLPDQVNGRWAGIETGASYTGSGNYYNAWIHFPDMGAKAWQQLSSPFKTEAEAIEFINNYKK